MDFDELFRTNAYVMSRSLRIAESMLSIQLSTFRFMFSMVNYAQVPHDASDVPGSSKRSDVPVELEHRPKRHRLFGLLFGH